MTERLYYTDSFLTAFDARIVETRNGGTRVILDRTAFYPSSGGQPHDCGSLNGVPVIDVIDEEDVIVHVLARPLPQSDQVHGAIDWPRRFDHMQQHSGQHLLSAVFEESQNLRTASFHLGTQSSTIDLDAPSITAANLALVERRANELVWADRPLSISFEEASAAEGLRKEAQRTGTLRIVAIDGCDRSACGGTHVRSTGQIGALLLRKTEKIRSQTRVEFLCGGRAVAQARLDFETLSQSARLLSTAPGEIPAALAALVEQARQADKSRRRLALDLAQFRGKALFESCAPDEVGRRVYVEERPSGALGEEIRACALAFCTGGNALFIATSADPPAVLLAAGAGSGIHAGSALQAALESAGGRGGGAAQSAQGSLPSATLIPQVVSQLLQR